MPPEPLDLVHRGTECVIGSYLLESADGPALFDCGPASCVPRLRERLRERGLELRELRHLLLSHIHLDHAGAAGSLVREHPGLQVHVSEIAAPHLIDPSRLERSARRLYGDELEELYGELVPVPEANVHATGSEVVGLECFPAPGHASHHVCYLDADGTLYAGDAAGVRIQPSATVLPPTPPPEADVVSWNRTIDEMERRAPAKLALVHFGVADDPERHLAELRAGLERWSTRVRDGSDEAEFVAAAELELAERGEPIALYQQAMPFWQSYAGLRRYWEKRREQDAAAV